eukprot:scpid64135/ scgid25123/ RAB6-interacting golgin; N-terminal kinase-like-binding protein 1; SCY1-like 1-binding protein 1
MTMASWEGFSDADLQRLKGSSVVVHSYTGKAKSSQLAKKQNRKTAASRTRPAAKSASAARPYTDSERSSPEQPVAASSSTKLRVVSSEGSVSSVDAASTSMAAATASSSAPTLSRKRSSGSTEGDAEIEVRLCTDDELQSMKKSRLEELHKQQKELEKVNLEKKKQLQQTIAQRKEEAQKETQRLTTVQKELSRLDNIVSTDVSVLREKIEEANAAFNEAQQRYDAAEAEFVSAKVTLHRCGEQKELLMEHLMTIIEQTELRKANKLAELMGTLDVGESQQGGTASNTPSNGSAAAMPDANASSQLSSDVANKDHGDEEADGEDDDVPQEPVTLLGLAQSADEEEGRIYSE